MKHWGSLWSFHLWCIWMLIDCNYFAKLIQFIQALISSTSPPFNLYFWRLKWVNQCVNWCPITYVLWGKHSRLSLVCLQTSKHLFSALLRSESWFTVPLKIGYFLWFCIPMCVGYAYMLFGDLQVSFHHYFVHYSLVDALGIYVWLGCHLLYKSLLVPSWYTSRFHRAWLCSLYALTGSLTCALIHFVSAYNIHQSNLKTLYAMYFVDFCT